jgi:hypothetical protein
MADLATAQDMQRRRVLDDRCTGHKGFSMRKPARAESNLLLASTTDPTAV